MRRICGITTKSLIYRKKKKRKPSRTLINEMILERLKINLGLPYLPCEPQYRPQRTYIYTYIK